MRLLDARAAVFDTKDARIALKYEHTMRATTLCDEVDVSYGTLFGGLSLAWLCSLLHDIDRYGQLRIWGVLRISHRVAIRLWLRCCPRGLCVVRLLFLLGSRTGTLVNDGKRRDSIEMPILTNFL